MGCCGSMYLSSDQGSSDPAETVEDRSLVFLSGHGDMEEKIRCCVSLFIVVNGTFPCADLVEQSNRGRRSGGRREEHEVKNGGTDRTKGH